MNDDVPGASVPQKPPTDMELFALRQLERIYLRVGAWEELVGVYDRLVAISARHATRHASSDKPKTLKLYMPVRATFAN